jgi:putative transposase
VDGRGVPLSLIVTGANVNDGKRLDEVLNAVLVKRTVPPERRSKHLCADAGYRSAENLRIIEDHGYIAHVVDRRREADAKRRDPKKKARRWVVEVCHRWFNRFRKLLVRYEKLERSFVALNHLAAAIIAFRKVPMIANIIYG